MCHSHSTLWEVHRRHHAGTEEMGQLLFLRLQTAMSTMPSFEWMKSCYAHYPDSGWDVLRYKYLPFTDNRCCPALDLSLRRRVLRGSRRSSGSCAFGRENTGA